MNVYARRAIDGTLIINKSGIEGIGYGWGESFLKKSLIFLKRILYDNIFKERYKEEVKYYYNNYNLDNCFNGIITLYEIENVCNKKLYDDIKEKNILKELVFNLNSKQLQIQQQ